MEQNLGNYVYRSKVTNTRACARPCLKYRACANRLQTGMWSLERPHWILERESGMERRHWNVRLERLHWNEE